MPKKSGAKKVPTTWVNDPKLDTPMLFREYEYDFGQRRNCSMGYPTDRRKMVLEKISDHLKDAIKKIEDENDHYLGD